MHYMFPKFNSDFAKKKIGEFNAGWKDYVEIHTKMINLVQLGNIPAAVKVQRGESRTVYDKIVADLEGLSTSIQL